MTWQDSSDERKHLSPFHYLNTAVCHVTTPSCALAPEQTLFGLSVTEAVLSAAQADTLRSLPWGFAQSEPCDHRSQHGVAVRHLHHMRFELHGVGRLRTEGHLQFTHKCTLYTCTKTHTQASHVHKVAHKGSQVLHVCTYELSHTHMPRCTGTCKDTQKLAKEINQAISACFRAVRQLYVVIKVTRRGVEPLVKNYQEFQLSAEKHLKSDPMLHVVIDLFLMIVNNWRPPSVLQTIIALLLEL